jgi:ligand-binding sensor domain-containing protein/anti-sigma regulatory factor (Ser/Thr protein kinase)
MRYRVATILFICLFSMYKDTHAQSDTKYIFRHIDQSDGLLHNRVLSLVQDSRGFMWILTPNGLQRYDGSRFVNYPYALSNAGQIIYSSNAELFADKKNDRLWIAQNSIAMLDMKTNRFTFYDTGLLTKDSSFGFENYSDSLGNSWQAGKFGALRSDNNSRKMMPYHLTASWLSPGRSHAWFTDEKMGESWLAVWSYGLLLFDKKTKEIYSHSYNPLHYPLLQKMNSAFLYCIFKDSRGNVWMGSNKPVFYRFDPVTQKVFTYSLNDMPHSHIGGNQSGNTSFVNCFFEDDHHSIWIGTQNAGLLKYDREKNNFITISGEKESKNSIQYNYEINCIFQDKEKNIWLATDKGITVFNPYQQYFQSIYHEENNPSSLPKNEIQDCIQTITGDLLVGTWGGGITMYDDQLQFKKKLPIAGGPEERNLLWSFIENDNGTIWAGCQHGYIHIYDPLKKTIKTIRPPEANNFTIRCMAKDAGGNILMGLHNGTIIKWAKAENKFYRYNNGVPYTQKLLSPVLTIYIDGNNNCWAGTENGFKKFDAEKMTYTDSYRSNKNDSSTISSNIVQCVDEVNDSTLAIGTRYGGLNFFNKRTQKFTHLSTGNDLPANTINNLKPDALKNIWLTTDYGLYKYIPAENRFVNYNIEPGIVNSSFRPGNFYCLKNGKWLALTTTEIISFNPDSLQKQETNNLRVDIAGFKIFNKDLFIDSLLYDDKPVKLSYRQNFISIEYGALNFSQLQEIKYEYMMSGVDKDWVYAGTKRVASYTDLQPGEYIFNVKAGEKGDKEKITSFKIIITPPFWDTAWFRVAVLLLGAFSVYLLFRKRIKTIRHEAELKQRIAETEMMALRAQMNPHFIFNCINSIDALIQSNDKYHATIYLNKFAKLIRNILDSSKQNTVTLAKDLDTLQLYIELEQLRNENKFIAKISADDELMRDDYQVPPLIIQPFVENAILHGIRYRKGNDGKLSVSVNKHESYLQYIIEDNGVGRNAFSNQELQAKTSYGINMSTDRIKLFNDEEKPSVQITDLFTGKEPAGTKVEVLLKIQ